MNMRRDPDHDLERLLDEDGGEFAAIYRRLSRAEPPRRLDRAVIANAARAVRGDRAPPAQRWLLGFGSAAGIVLAAGIAWQVGKQIESHDAQTGAARSERAVIPVEPISESTRLRKSVPPETEAAFADKDLPAEPIPPKREPARQSKRKVVSPPPAPAAAPPSPAPARPLILEQQAKEEELAPVLPRADEAQPFAEKKPGDSSKNDAGALRGALGERREQAAGNAATSVPKAAVEQSRAPAPSSSIKLRQNMHLAPQDWLAEIVRLKNSGRRQEAIENLRLFRRMHPDWQLSDELRRLAE